MEKSARLLDIENSIRKYTTNIIANAIENKKLGRNLLMINLSGMHSSILMYDETKGLSEIGVIRYSIRNGSVFISEFEVDENFQCLGIGRTMFEFALAHGDAFGSNCVYGYAKPTNNIKGVSEAGKDKYKEEQEAIMKVYKKLGCNFDNPINKNTIDKMFEQRWQSGEKYGQVKGEMQQILANVVQFDRSQGFGLGKGK